MPIRNFQMPEKLVVDQVSDTHGTFIIEPLEPGYGHTIGSALRRVLISSLEGYAITSVKLPSGVLHEFATIQGVVEDVSEIILNLKRVRFKKIGTLDQDKLVIKLKDKTRFTAGDLAKATASFAILNPDHVICHMDESANFKLELNVQKGRGYMPAEEISNDTQVVGLIPIDAIFSPIRNVKYRVENTLVGQKADFEKIILEVVTDRSIAPTQAIQAAARSLISHFALFTEQEVIPEGYRPEETMDEETMRIQRALNMPIRELDLSSRAYNSLIANDVKKVADIVKLGLAEVIQFKNFGKKSITEVKELLAAKGLHFGMDISGYEQDEES